MRRSIRCFLSLAIVLAGIRLASAAAAAGLQSDPTSREVLHSVTINVINGEDNQPLANARVRLTRLSGGRMRKLQYPSDSTEYADTNGVHTDSTGRVVAVMEPGEYMVTLEHPNFVSSSFRLVLAADAPEDERDTTCDWPMKTRPEFGARWLMAEVYRSRTSDDSPVDVVWLTQPVPVPASRFIPLANAHITAYDEDGWYIQSGYTTKKGIAALKSPGFVIGDFVRVKAEAGGFLPERGRILIGSSQANPTAEQIQSLSDADAPVLTPMNRTTSWDGVRFLLREGEVPDKPGSVLVVVVEDQATGGPLPNALVRICDVHDASLGERTTGTDGKIGGVRIPLTPDGKPPDGIRVKASLDGYEEAWSDVPPDLLTPSTEPRIYLVNLKKAAVPPPGAAGGFSGTWNCDDLAIGPLVLSASATSVSGTWGTNGGRLQGSWDDAKKGFIGTWTQKPGAKPDPSVDQGAFVLQMMANGKVSGLWSMGPGKPTGGYLFTLTKAR